MNFIYLQTHHCAMVALASVNTTYVTPASSLPCARPRLRKASGLFLCANPEDMLVDRACLQLTEGQRRISSWPHLHRAIAFRLDLDNYDINQSII